MDKPTKQITIDFDLYLKEKEDLHRKSFVDGMRRNMASIIIYLKKGDRLKDIVKDQDYFPEWEPLLKALGREVEWDEFIEYRKTLKPTNEECKNDCSK